MSFRSMACLAEVLGILFMAVSAVGQGPSNSAPSRAEALAAYTSGDYATAALKLKQVLEANPDDKEATQLIGLSYYFSGRPKEAIPYLEKVQSWVRSANVDANYVLGICYVQSLRYDDARHAFAKMYSVAPDSAAAHLFNARMLLRQGMDPVAENEAKAAIASDAQLPLAHRLLGELYLFKSRIPEAIEQFRAELKINPADAATYYKLADADTRMMNFDEAEKLLQSSIWLDNTASGPYILMGKVLLHKNEYTLAERSLGRALTMDPNNYIAHHLLGETYRAQGRSHEAEMELTRSQQLEAAQTQSKVEAHP